MRFVKRTYGDGRVKYVALDVYGIALREFDTEADLREYKTGQEAILLRLTFTDQDINI